MDGLKLNSLSKIYNKLYNLKIGQITSLQSQGNILFLKLNDKRVTNQKSLDLEKLKKNLINRKKMNYLLCIQGVTYLN